MAIRRYLTGEVLVRVVADVVIVNCAYLAALVLRLLWRIATDPATSARTQLLDVQRVYLQTFWLLTIIAISFYGVCGFYSRGRIYRGRFKALIIFQAVSLSYVLFGFALYLAQARGWLAQSPGLALLLAWLLTFSITLVSRLYAALWGLVISNERHVHRKRRRDARIRNVLVIGGAGYIGSVLCRQLLRRGYAVRVLDALLYGAESLAEFKDDPDFELLEGDSRDVCNVFRAVLDVDAVVHLGELVGDPACAIDKVLTLETNLVATCMVIEAARGLGVKRFVYASSCSVYGASREILDERSALSPVSLYARAKIGAEGALLALNGSDFHPVILRFATVYGLSPRPRFDLVINLLTAKAVCDGEITIFGGEQWRPFVHVADVARAIMRCLEAPLGNVKGRIFNVGCDEQNYTIAQVGELIQRLIPEVKLIKRADDTDTRDYRVSFAKIRRELDFEPQHTVEEGVREIEVALRDGRIADYRLWRYNNHKTLSDLGLYADFRSRRAYSLYAPALSETAQPDFRPSEAVAAGPSAK